MDRDEIELCGCARPEIDFGAGMRGKLMMAGNKIRVAVGFDDIPNFKAVGLCVFKIDTDVALGIDYSGFRTGTDEI